MNHRHRLELVQTIEGQDQWQRQARLVITGTCHRLEAVACHIGAALRALQGTATTRFIESLSKRLESRPLTHVVGNPLISTLIGFLVSRFL